MKRFNIYSTEGSFAQASRPWFYQILLKRRKSCRLALLAKNPTVANCFLAGLLKSLLIHIFPITSRRDGGPCFLNLYSRNQSLLNLLQYHFGYNTCFYLLFITINAAIIIGSIILIHCRLHLLLHQLLQSIRSGFTNANTCDMIFRLIRHTSI